jgi:hypothetical protein
MASELRSNTAYSFSGHETFPFRYTWLPKGVRHLQNDSELFGRDHAIVTLGVGKNMVRAIRYWCIAIGAARRADRGQVEVTDLGRRLFDPEGWDPYLEDPGTLWLLHWRLVSRPSPASTWHLAFTRWNRDYFSRDELADWLLDFTRGVSGTQPTPASLRRDVDVFLRTYIPSRTKRDRSLEDTFDCPLVELGLLAQENPRDLYRFVRGPKPTLPDGIFAHALIDYWQLTAPNERTLSFESILHGLGGLGGAFKLSENALAERLERMPEWTGITYDDTAGMRVLLRQDVGDRFDPMVALAHYYEGHYETTHSQDREGQEVMF